MAHDLFALNLAELAHRHPALAERVAALPSPDGSLQPLEGKRGLPTVRATTPDGRRVLLHSQYDPVTEAQRAVASAAVGDARMAVVFGFGLGYHIEALLAAHGRGLERLIVLEARLDLFALALRLRDLRPLWRLPGVHLVVGGSAEDVFELAFTVCMELLTSQPALIPHSPSMNLASSWYKAAQEQLVVAARMGSWSAQTKMVLGRTALLNVIRNYTAMAALPGIERLLGRFTDVPAFIVAAGPSLDKNIDQLRRVGDRGLIVCVDTVLRRLLAAGVRPHIVCTIDSHALSMRHLDGVAPPPETVLAVDIECCPEIRGPFPGPKTVIWVRKNNLLCWLEDQIGGRGAVEKGNTVAHTAFFVARDLGATRLIFVGQDLAYPREPGVTHASGTSFRAQWRWANPAKTHLIQPNPLQPGENQVIEVYWVSGVDGAPVPTIPQLFTYLRQFERQIRGTATPCIDATEGGALIGGTTLMSLSDAIDAYCVAEADLTARIHAALAAAPDDRLRALAALRQWRAELREGASLIGEAMRHGARLRELALREHPDDAAMRAAGHAMRQTAARAMGMLTVNHTVEGAAAAAAIRFMQRKPRFDAVIDVAYHRREEERYRLLFEGALEACNSVGAVLDEEIAAAARQIEAEKA